MLAFFVGQRRKGVRSEPGNSDSPCDARVIAGRMRKAEQFLTAAENVRDLAENEEDARDAFVTLCVHAGIAASDVLCCLALGQHARGEDHQEAIALVRRVAPGGGELANALSVLLGMKTRAAYGDATVTADQVKRAERAAKRLLDAARQRRTG
jgi:hypothetical protein